MLNGFEGFLTTSKYVKLAKCSPDTALRDIRELLERGILVKNSARGRGTSYRLAEPDAIAVDSDSN
jgi:Fic family protein